MQIHPKLLDNSGVAFQLKEFLCGRLLSGEFTQLSVATGYWDLPAVIELLPALEVF